ncbi:MAG: hypothetical protein ABJA70_15915 [Chryseolinea sp.]
MKFVVFIAGLLAAAVDVTGQKLVGESKLPPVEHDGFYRIVISPSLSSHLNRGFTNIRIHDDKGSEVPYLFESERANHFTTTFKNYDIIEKRQVRSCCTTLTLANVDGHSINNISLSIKNAEVTKNATLLGSDDKENWYALKDQFIINSIANTKKTSEINIVDFPLSNYSYYRVIISDSLTAPLNILGAGYYETKSEEGKYSKVPVKVLARDSISVKKTFLALSFDSAQVLDRLFIKMKGAPYFLREAELFIKRRRTNRKKAVEYYFDYVSPFVLSSKQSSVIELNAEFVKELRIVVQNKDNPPLQVSDIEAYQLNRYLTAWLSAGQSYSVAIGGRELQAPAYDIGHFKDKIPADITTLEASPFKMFDNVSVAASKTFFTSSVFVWVAIVLVIGVLGFMAVRMARETSAR